jgi:hypothetical protein
VRLSTNEDVSEIVSGFVAVSLDNQEIQNGSKHAGNCAKRSGIYDRTGGF